jgi:hypothetical protein
MGKRRSIWVILLHAILVVSAYPSAKKEEPVEISNLIIVYTPGTDHNAAFSNLAERLKPIIDAAKDKKIKIVLLNENEVAVDYKNGDPKVAFNERLLSTVKSQKGKSFVIVADHGGERKTKLASGKFQSDTELSFGGGMLYSDMAEVLSDSSVQGLLVASCNSFNDFLSRGGPPVRCAVNRMGGSSGKALDFYSQALGKLISSDVPVKIGPELYSNVKCQMIDFSKTDKYESGANWNVSNDKCGFKPPIAFSKKAADTIYTFRGNKFEITDDKNGAVKPCSINDTMIFPGIYPPSVYFSLDTPVIFPDRAALESKFYTWREGTILRCNKDGSLALENAVKCEKSFPVEKTSDGSYSWNFNPQGDAFKPEVVKAIKVRTDKFLNFLAKNGVAIPSTFCLPSCTLPYSASVFLGGNITKVSMAAGSCDPKGRGFYCSGLPGDFSIDRDPACCNPSKEDERYIVKDSKTGECTTACPPEVRAEESYEKRSEMCFTMSTAAPVEGSLSLFLLENPIQNTLPTYACAGPNENKFPVFSKKCCEKAGGTVVQDNKSLRLLGIFNTDNFAIQCVEKSKAAKLNTGEH